MGHRAGGRQIAQLALPALGVLAAEPLYLLFDIAVVGRLGAISLAGLAIGSLVLGLVGSQATFLSYGTTARAARRYGAGNRVAAVTEGVQATWLALGLGALVVVVVEATATPLVSAIASGDGITAAALPWLRIAILGTPAILVSLAGNGWLRGVQDTVRPLRYVVAGFGSSALLCPLLVYGWLGLPRWVNRLGGGQSGGAVAGGAAVCRCVTGRAGVAAAGPRRAGRPADDGAGPDRADPGLPSLLCLGCGGGREVRRCRARGPPGRVAVVGSSCAGS